MSIPISIPVAQQTVAEPPSPAGAQHEVLETRPADTRTTSYQYTPLNEDLNEIRLLHLLPGSPSNPIHLNIEIIPFTTDDVPTFNALSYCWGSEEDPLTVFIGESEEVTLAVTRNVAEALPYLRFKDKSVTLWIDAICVNQKDLEERSKQVRRMAEIYSKAYPVVVWLGPESDDSEVAIECVEKIASRIKVNPLNLTMKAITEEKHWADSKCSLPFTRPQSRALSNLLGRSWFYRLWVWQEVHLATLDPVVLCGWKIIPWSALRTGVFGLFMKPESPGSHGVLEREHIRTAYSLLFGDNSDRLDVLLRETRHTKCTDPRDRVFALFSLTRRIDGMHELESDFTKSVHEVYRDVMVHWTRKTGSLTLLCMVEAHDYLLGVPSWVPDWSNRRSTENLLYGFAGGLTETTIPSDFNGEVLPAVGVIVGEIQAAEDFDFTKDGDKSIDTVSEELCRIVSRLDITGPFIPGGKLARDLCRVVVENRYVERSLRPNATELSFENIERTICHALNVVNGWPELSTRKARQVSESLKRTSPVVANLVFEDLDLSNLSIQENTEGEITRQAVGSPENKEVGTSSLNTQQEDSKHESAPKSNVNLDDGSNDESPDLSSFAIQQSTSHENAHRSHIDTDDETGNQAPNDLKSDDSDSKWSDIPNSESSSSKQNPHISDIEPHYYGDKYSDTPTLSNSIFPNVTVDERFAFETVRRCCSFRSLFLTRSGNLGLAPSKALPGDLIATLLGCPSAIILRPVQNQNNKHKVLGEAFCQGFLYGEGLLGPLPDGMEPILYYSSRLGGYWWTFLNLETKEFVREDPRLGDLDLPEGWTREGHEDEEKFSIFVKGEGGEMLGNIDPRMRVEELRKRGVVGLREFELV